MKNIFRRWFRLSLLVFSGIVLVNCQSLPEKPESASDKRPLQIILLAGQSNMEGAGNFEKISIEMQTKLEAIGDRIQIRNAGKGATPVRYTLSPYKFEKYGFEKSFGPEVGLAVALAERYPKQEFLFIKTTRGGTSLYGAWAPKWTDEKADEVEKPGDKRTKAYYALHMRHVEEALVELDAKSTAYNVAAVLWLQGENDAAKEISARTYEINLTSLIAQYRIDMGTPNLPFVVGQINSTYGRFKPGPDMVRTAMVTVAESDPTVGIIHTTTDRNWPKFPKHSDNVHYNTEGQLRWGAAFADRLDALGAFE